MNLTIACMARNEIHRFWPKVLEVWNDFADSIIVLDDNSTDETAHTARDEGAYLIPHAAQSAKAWGKEAPKRKLLFEACWERVEVGDYIFFLDADMIPARCPRAFMDDLGETFAFSLYDLWEPKRYRDDSYWKGHFHPRPWMIKRTEEEGPWEWNERGIHCGHFPLNLRLSKIRYAPDDFSILHYAYVTPELRAAKHEQYMSVRRQLTDFEWAHAESILKPDPTLKDLPFEPEYSLL